MARDRKLSVTLNNAGKVPVTKLDAAVRQLETAITLWFQDGDPVAICTLTFAGHEIIHAINTHRNGSPMIPDLFPKAKTEQQKSDLNILWRLDSNFFKHAGKDPEKTHYIAPDIYPLVMSDAVSAYNRLGFPGRPLFLALLVWLSLTHPESAAQELKEHLAKFQTIYRQGGFTKRQFLEQASQFFTSYLSRGA